jgi:hypothetical protein
MSGVPSQNPGQNPDQSDIRNLYPGYPEYRDTAMVVEPNGAVALPASPQPSRVAGGEGQVTLRVHRIPANTPGYLRRQREILGITKRMATEPEAVVELVNFFLKYCKIEYDGPVAPGQTEREAIAEAFLDLSQEELMAIVQRQEASTVSPQSAAS